MESKVPTEVGSSKSKAVTQAGLSASNVPGDAGLYDLLGWLDVHKKQLGLGLGVIALVAAIVAAFVNHQAQKEVRASQALSEIRVPFNPGTPAPPGTAEALIKFAQEHSGSRAASRALLSAGSVLFTEKNYAGAQTQFERVGKEYPESEWLAQAALGAAKAIDAQGKTNDAISAFENVRRRWANSEVIDEVKLSLGRLYELQKPEEAFKLYDELVKGPMAGSSGLAAEAGMRQEELVKAHPELEKLRAPPPNPITLTPPGLTGNSNIQVTMSTQQTMTAMTNLNLSGTGGPVQIRTLTSPAQPTPGAPNPPPLIARPPELVPAPAPAPATAPAPKKP